MNHISQLKSVVALARHRHFARAADAIGMTQPALSQNISRIEDMYGVPLFVRDRKAIGLTAYGEVVVKTAQAALDAIAQADREINLLRNLETGHLVVGADPYIISALLAPALTDVLGRHPNLRFTLRTGDWAALEPALLEDEIDILFGLRPNQPHAAIKTDIIDLPNARIMCRPAHELADQQPIHFEQAARFPIVSPAPPDWYANWVQSQIDQFKDKKSVADLIILRTDDVSVMKQVAKNSHALTAAFPSDIQNEIAAGDLLVLKMKDWPVTIEGSIGMRAGRTVPPAADMLLQAFRNAVKSEHALARETPGSDC